MSSLLEVRRVQLTGTDRPWSWEFGRGLTVISGPIGTGKTTLLHLIKHGLGADASLIPEVVRAADSVVLTVEIDGRSHRLRRSLRAPMGRVLVTSPDGSERALPTRPTQGALSISDWLLGALNLPALRVPRRRQRAGGELTSITFNDVLTYLYLEQEDVDRATAKSGDSNRDAKRRYTFEMLYRLLDRQGAELRLQRHRSRATLDTQRAELEAVERFLAEAHADQPAEALASPAIDRTRELQALQGSIAEEQARLSRLDEEVDGLLRRADEAAGLVLDRQRDRQQASEQFEGLRRVEAQVRLDIERLERAASAGRVFSAFEFVQCPRCLQELRREHAAGDCRLCGQLEPTPGEDTTSEERDRLGLQLVETVELVRRAGEELEVADARLGQAAQHHHELLGEADRVRAQAAEGSLRRLGELERQLAVRRGEELARQRAERVRTALLGRRQQVQRLATQLDEAQRRIEEDERSDEERSGRVSQLSEIFDEVLRSFDLPWFGGSAWVDPDTYLPMVDGRDLTSLSSGGMKAMANVAYYVANLTYSLRDPQALLPRFLMIDSPRKDLGADDDDLHRAERIYRWMLTMESTARMRGFSGGAFQMLLVDNDVPASVRNEVTELPLERDSPLIPTGELEG